MILLFPSFATPRRTYRLATIRTALAAIGATFTALLGHTATAETSETGED